MGKNDFIFGMNIHRDSYEAYPGSMLDTNLDSCRDMGMNLIRINIIPKNEEGFEYAEEVSRKIHSRGMKMMLCVDEKVIFNGKKTGADYYNLFRKIAERLKGKIDYYQVFNELDVTAMHTDLGAIYNAGDGKVKDEYDPTRLPVIADAVKNALKGLKDGDPDALSCINYCWWHTYYIEYLVSRGCEWDITGCDWYSDAESKSSFMDVLEWLHKEFGNKPVIICETNWWAYLGKDKTENERQILQKDWVCEFTKHLYNDAPDNFMGLIYYELLDEMAFEHRQGSYNPESHFGFMNNDSNGQNVKPKAVACEIRNIIKNLI